MNIKTIVAAVALVFALANAKIIYPMAYIVTDINNAENTVTISDANGFTYEFEGVEDYMVGDIVACIMYSGEDEHIFDDEIVYHRYAGHITYFNNFYTEIEARE